LYCIRMLNGVGLSWRLENDTMQIYRKEGRASRRGDLGG